MDMRVELAAILGLDIAANCQVVAISGHPDADWLRLGRTLRVRRQQRAHLRVVVDGQHDEWPIEVDPRPRRHVDERRPNLLQLPRQRARGTCPPICDYADIESGTNNERGKRTRRRTTVTRTKRRADEAGLRRAIGGHVNRCPVGRLH